MSKVTDSQKMLIVVLLMVIVMFAAYQYGYRYFASQRDAIQTENEDLERVIAQRKVKVENEKKYEAETLLNRKLVEEITKQFGPGVTPEKSILFFIDLCEQADMEISSISFGTPVSYFNGTHLKGEDGMPMTGYRTTFGITYKTTYEGLKACVDYINQYPERMNMVNLTMAYSAEDAALTGTMSIDWYSLVGNGEEYTFPALEQIDLGNGNVFRSGSMSLPETTVPEQ